MKQRLAKRQGVVLPDDANSVPPTTDSAPIPLLQSVTFAGAVSSAAGSEEDDAAAAVFVDTAADSAAPSPSLSTPPAARRGCLRTLWTAARFLSHGVRHRCRILQQGAKASLPSSLFSSTKQPSAQPLSSASHAHAAGHSSYTLSKWHPRTQRGKTKLRRCFTHAHFRTLKLSLYVTGFLFLLGVVSDALLGVVLRRIEKNMDMSGDPQTALYIAGDERIPWLTCDCAGEGVLGGVEDLPEDIQRSLRGEVQELYHVVDLSCGVCTSALDADTHSMLSKDVEVVLVGSKEATRTRSRSPSFALAQIAGTAWQGLHVAVNAVLSFIFPNSMLLFGVLQSWYTTHVGAVAALRLQDRQNRGVGGSLTPLPTPLTFAKAVLRAMQEGDQAGLRQEDVDLIDGSDSAVQHVCRDRSLLERVGLPRHALPWLEIDAAHHRPMEAIRTPEGAAREEKTREITVAVPSPLNGFQSYFCSDMVNISRANAGYVLDAMRKAIVDRSRRRLTVTSVPQQQQQHEAGIHPPTESICRRCEFQCIHPRLFRHLQRTHAVSHGVRGSTITAGVEGGAISWDVSVEDVDAGRVRLPAGGVRGVDPHAREVIVTRGDLFTCKLLSPTAEGQSLDPENRELLLSTDVWLSHFSGALPFFVHTRRPSTTEARPDGGGATGADNTSAPPVASRTFPNHSSVPFSFTRVLPLHTAAVYGESLQSFPDYALRMAHWLQFDSVHLPHHLRRPSLLSGSEALPATTAFATWTVAHLYLRDFQLIVYFNQQRRSIQHPATPQRGLTLSDVSSAASTASGVLPRLALELLDGADPMLLPLLHESLSESLTHNLAWHPPTAVEWGRSSPPSAGTASNRIPAVAVAISHCWHGRLWWLSELSRYYPVHNYGRCRIPVPSPLPGDIPEGSTASAEYVPRRARYDFPAACAAEKIQRRHTSALARTRRRSLSRTSGQPRELTHLPRDYELRCVFRSYKYVLAFENSVEDDYVTEKVYNAMLSGAVPLYVGAMNIERYVPRSGRAAPFLNSSATLLGLSVLPILQLFPLLNETAARLEDRRVLTLHQADELVSRRLLRTHATVLRARATRARASLRNATLTSPPVSPPSNGTASQSTECAWDERASMADMVADALNAAAGQVPQSATNMDHVLLYSTAPHESATAVHGVTNRRKGASRGPARFFAHSAGTWPMSLTPVNTANLEGTANMSTNQIQTGFSTFLQRVHRDTTHCGAYEVPSSAPQLPYAALSINGGGRGVGAGKRAVRKRADRGFALTANTAFAFAEEVAQQRAATPPGRSAECPSCGHTPTQPSRIESFAETDAGEGGVGRHLNATAGGSSVVRWSRGNAFSKYFVRRPLPSAPSMYAAAGMHGAEGPAMSGFAQLAAYLRALDADPRLVEKAGIFDWWAAEGMEEFGEAFLESLHVPHPICSICAAALEKKEMAEAAKR